MRASRFRYGAWRGGPDPLAPPYDVRAAVDQVGNEVLAGGSLREALRDLLPAGPGRRPRGLDDLAARARRMRREAAAPRQPGRRGHPRPGPARPGARRRTRGAGRPGHRRGPVRRGAAGRPAPVDRRARSRSSPTTSGPATRPRQLYQQILDGLRQEVLDQRFAGMRQALQGAADNPEAQQRVTEMLHDLNDLLGRHARGEDTADSFREFMDQHGEFFPEKPENVDELIDSLARRAGRGRAADALPVPAAARGAGRADGAGVRRRPAGGRDGRAHRQPARAAARPAVGAARAGARRATTRVRRGRRRPRRARRPGRAARPARPGASRRDPGRRGRRGGRAHARPRRRRRRTGAAGTRTRAAPPGLGDPRRRRADAEPEGAAAARPTALRTVFAQLGPGRRGQHDVRDAGAAGEATGASRRWEFGDEQPIDVVRTVANAVRRGGRDGAGAPWTVEDFEMVETERRASAAVALCVDLSFSMIAEGRWGPMKQTALALSHLVATRFPQDALQIIGFGRYAMKLSRASWPAIEPDMVQGTNLQHALKLAGRHLRRHSDAEPVVLVVTDGEPTAHLDDDGEARVPLAAGPGDDPGDRGRGGQADPVRCRRSTCSCSARTRGCAGSSTPSPGATAAGCSRRTPTTSAGTWSATTSAPGAAGAAESSTVGSASAPPVAPGPASPHSRTYSATLTCGLICSDRIRVSARASALAHWWRAMKAPRCNPFGSLREAGPSRSLSQGA